MARFSRHSVRFSQERREIAEKSAERSEGRYHFPRPDRSRYPGGWKWIIFALAGSLLLFFVAKFFITMWR
ncbi:MAG: hypothetical protein DRN14_05510 [Thermoplasmata archaeon]|nr:MAG: hypothetical protein DRN14_05510 [Thermoplasmata archaeon]HDG68385.1 hypothetical protein [candidate division Zixibacteria bacterium]